MSLLTNARRTACGSRIQGLCVHWKVSSVVDQGEPVMQARVVDSSYDWRGSAAVTGEKGVMQSARLLAPSSKQNE